MKNLLNLLFIGIILELFSCLEAASFKNRGDDDGTSTSVSVVLNSKNVLEVKDGVVKPFVAYAAFKNSMNKTGYVIFPINFSVSIHYTRK